ncbi:LacI family DNA-binding transcriptional regulator [Rhizobium lentis]|uniref:LacI family DNA-binding transcriptional regulator n=1 Tax=Rhizobium TaxID=379 RepID=UPI00160B84A7|nr:LacI family DNA-binding transcriptional regulator [Rhizobium lentis]MBB3352599.1 LacI family transcriptional regulator [Rhizobium sp. BK049]MBX5135974.1 LacI family DNA-binding transcriptional regulator [Rhizobium lentis]MBX5138181.1 LacI family DNA-binding transcriptional regulator [Rhizobium lentis]MBX5151285.1 LacI family DNA-binding transcriptional regulator [Rhizobium lentis]MBX5176465.1 LacI family DNA-binding transcriptional regulator [Rhizobium lentis]
MAPKAVTLIDVARAANVSRATAARALNGYGYVGGDAAERVLAAADRLGYRSNRVAQALRRGQLPLIGFMPGDIQNPFFARIAHDVDVDLRAFRHNLLIASSEEDPEQEVELLESLRSLNVRGFIVAPTSADNKEHLVGLVREGTPLVLIDRALPHLACDSVTVDNEGGAREAVSYLIANGHRRIGLIQDDSRITTARGRLAGYIQALQSHGIEVDESLIIVSRSTVEYAIDATIRLFSRPSRPTAVFTVDSLMTQGALLGLRSMGLAVPHAVSLVGFDDFNLATFTDPQITVVAQPIAQIGPLAVKLLIQRINGSREPPHREQFPTRLVVRGSVSRPSRTPGR